jgi:DNA-binding transcriptional LysR family regulator
VRLLADFDDLEASLSQARAAPRGRLRVDVGTSMARLLIIPRLAEFQARYPTSRSTWASATARWT